MSYNWGEYYNNTNHQPPKPLLVKAITCVKNKDKVIDIGGGGLIDAKYLIEQGFDVTVIDKSPLVEDQAKEIPSDKLHVFNTSFEEFNFKEKEYDLASAMFALPFINSNHFNRVFKDIKNSIKDGGIFTGHFFGNNDSWNDDTKMTFHTKEQVQELLSDMEVISFFEKEHDGVTAKGDPKHWHIFYVIARK